MNAPLSKEQIALLMSDSMTVRSLELPGTDHTVAEPRPTFRSRVSALIGAWVERRTVLAELRGLSDRELVDIGLTRVDVGRVFDQSFAQFREQAVFRAANA